MRRLFLSDSTYTDEAKELVIEIRDAVSRILRSYGDIDMRDLQVVMGEVAIDIATTAIIERMEAADDNAN